jgi:hypothetical protein
MNRTIVRSRVGADGVLHVPLAAEDANQDVVVTIEPAEPDVNGGAGYSAWLQAVAGAWRGDFERPPQGTIEERDPLS